MTRVRKMIYSGPDSRTFIGLLSLAFIALAIVGAGRISSVQQLRQQQRTNRQKLISDWSENVGSGKTDTEQSAWNKLSDAEKAAIFRLTN